MYPLWAAVLHIGEMFKFSINKVKIGPGVYPFPYTLFFHSALFIINISRICHVVVYESNNKFVKQWEKGPRLPFPYEIFSNKKIITIMHTETHQRHVVFYFINIEEGTRLLYIHCIFRWLYSNVINKVMIKVDFVLCVYLRN